MPRPRHLGKREQPSQGPRTPGRRFMGDWQVGQGKIGADDIKRILAKRDRRVAGMTAPAHGLVLWKVFYKSKRTG